MERLLLTGATGFLGRPLLARLAQDHEVIVAGRSRPPGVGRAFIPWDLTNPPPPDLPARVDYVVHLAQDPGKDPARALDAFQVNTAATVFLHDYALRAGARTFLYASSGSTYGYRDGIISEDHPGAPVDFYGATKQAAETLMRRRGGPVRTVVLRYFVPYGPGQVDRMIPGLLARLSAGRPVVLNNGSGRPRTNPIYVDDAVEATLRALRLDEDAVLNVAGGEVVSVEDLALRLGRLLGATPVFEHARNPAIRDLVASTEAMVKALGWRPRVSLEEGLAQVVAAWPRR